MNSVRDEDSEPIAKEWPNELVDYAERRYRSAMKRIDAFPGAPLTDPAWMMMLDLFIKQARGHRVSVSSACLASNGSSATALRYIQLLIKRGIMVRTEDMWDQRRSWLALTESARDRIGNLLLKEIEPASAVPVRAVDVELPLNAEKRFTYAQRFQIMAEEIESLKCQMQVLTHKLEGRRRRERGTHSALEQQNCGAVKQ